MKITVITSNINTKSGWGRYSSSIINEYNNFGIDYQVITDKNYKKLDKENSILLPLNNIFNFFYNIHKVKKLASGSNIIHAFDGWPYSIYAYFAVFGTNKKLFINGVGTYSVVPLNNFLKSFLLSKAYRRAKKIFCISHYTKNKILEKIKLNNLKVVLLGKSDIPKISEDIIVEYNKKYGIVNSNYPIFLSVGAIKNRKGQYYSLQAIAKLSNKYPKFRYFILGSDADIGYINAIKEYIQGNNLFKNVIITNNASEEELAFFYSVSDIFILNSVNDRGHFEGFGLVFLEAAQFGLPVIGSKDCGIEDAMSDGYNGYLAKQKDIKDIYKNILKILDGDKQKLIANSQKFVKNFSWHKTVSQYYEYYKKN
jgi:glycosyltransferase involved in cell wall biosynthesis